MHGVVRSDGDIPMGVGSRAGSSDAICLRAPSGPLSADSFKLPVGSSGVPTAPLWSSRKVIQGWPCRSISAIEKVVKRATDGGLVPAGPPLQVLDGRWAEAGEPTVGQCLLGLVDVFGWATRSATSGR